MLPHNGFGRHAHLSASFTYRTTEGFQTSRSIRKSATSVQPVQLGHIIGRKPLRAFTFSTIFSHQLPSMPALISRSRATWAIGIPGIPSNPHRPLPKLQIDLPARL